MKIPIKENVLQALLIALNFVFALLGIALVGLGIVYMDDLSLIHVYVTGENLLKLPKLLIVLGALSFVSSLLGCYIIRNYNQTYLRIYIAFLTLLLAAQLTIGCLAFMNIEDTQENRTTVLMWHEAKTRTDFYIMEEHFRCCGVNNVDDYKLDELELHNGTLCHKIFERISRMPLDGCARVITDNIIRISMEIGSYMSVYAVFQIIDIACLFMRHFRLE